MATLADIRASIRKQASARRAKANAWFFKTGKGEYGEGDKFIGVTVPAARKIARQFRGAPLSAVLKLLHSNIHEERLIALLMLVHRYEVGDRAEQKKVFDAYLKNIKYVNNWDLVDLSASNIVGAHLLDRSRARLTKLAASRNMWKRRIAIIATARFIKHNQFADTLAIAKLLRHDAHDLIHKAVGWMLREVGKRDKKTLVQFLKTHYKHMPRTMLRYAIEKFPEQERRRYLEGTV